MCIRDSYILALYLARYAGLRIHECFRMDTAAAECALRENEMCIRDRLLTTYTSAR